MKTAERVSRLIDYATSRPDGFTYRDVKTDLGWSRTTFFKTVNRVRLVLGASDTINLICDPQGLSEPWLYRLVGTGVLTQPWQANRLGDMESRFLTMRNVARSVTAATDGRTTEGRKARTIDKALTRLLEDLEDLRPEVLDAARVDKMAANVGTA